VMELAIGILMSFYKKCRIVVSHYVAIRTLKP